MLRATYISCWLLMIVLQSGRARPPSAPSSRHISPCETPLTHIAAT